MDPPSPQPSVVQLQVNITYELDGSCCDMQDLAEVFARSIAEVAHSKELPLTVWVELVPPEPIVLSIGPGPAADLRPYGLTPKELLVLELLDQPLSNQGIADRLFVSINTVKSHVAAVYRKLGVSDRSAAVQLLRDAQGEG